MCGEKRWSYGPEHWKGPISTRNTWKHINNWVCILMYIAF